MYLFLLFISQIFDAFVEDFNLFLIILDILIKFLNSFLEFMLLTRFNMLDWAVAEAVNILVAVAEAVKVLVAVAEAVNVLVAVAVAEAVPPVVPMSVRRYESEGKWMFLFRGIIWNFSFIFGQFEWNFDCGIFLLGIYVTRAV